MKTRLDVLTRALRRLGVAAHDETLTADQIENSGAVYDALLTEIEATTGKIISGNAVEDEIFIPLAQLVAVEVAPEFGIAAPQTKGAAFLRLMAVLRPDDRTEISDAKYF